jgi:hypothetical protein
MGAVVRLDCALCRRLNDLSEYHRWDGEEHGDEKIWTQVNTTFATPRVSKQTGGGPLAERAPSVAQRGRMQNLEET